MRHHDAALVPGPKFTPFSMRLALYQPDIPQNAGAILRLAAAWGLPVDIIEPCGFVFDDRRLRRAGMDYIDLAEIARHSTWEAFLAQIPANTRLVLLTTRADESHTAFAFRRSDILLLGRESAGVPESVHERADARIRIPMRSEARSLNVAQAAAIAAGEAMRQLKLFERPSR